MAHVLIIDDDPLITKLLQEHLSNEGYAVDSVHLAEEGFERALKDTALSLKTVEDFWFAKGRADAFRQLLSYEDFILESKKAIDEAPEPEAISEDAE